MEFESMKYETEVSLNQYLLFHYGSNEDQMPFSFGPKEALGFPIRCVKECVNQSLASPEAKALDLDCSVGRSTFELARMFRRVVGVDLSKKFIETAKQIQTEGSISYNLNGHKRLAKRPLGIDPNKIHFNCLDILDFGETKTFEIVLAANLLCRLSDPVRFLKKLEKLTKSEGELILISPYSWLEEFTPRNLWLNAADVQDILKEHFTLYKTFDMPFLLSDHYRKYEWGVSQATLWKRQ